MACLITSFLTTLGDFKSHAPGAGVLSLKRGFFSTILQRLTRFQGVVQFLCDSWLVVVFSCYSHYFFQKNSFGTIESVLFEVQAKILNFSSVLSYYWYVIIYLLRLFFCSDTILILNADGVSCTAMRQTLNSQSICQPLRLSWSMTLRSL